LDEMGDFGRTKNDVLDNIFLVSLMMNILAVQPPCIAAALGVINCCHISSVVLCNSGTHSSLSRCERHWLVVTVATSV